MMSKNTYDDETGTKTKGTYFTQNIFFTYHSECTVCLDVAFEES